MRTWPVAVLLLACEPVPPASLHDVTLPDGFALDTRAAVTLVLDGADGAWVSVRGVAGTPLYEGAAREAVDLLAPPGTRALHLDVRLGDAVWHPRVPVVDGVAAFSLADRRSRPVPEVAFHDAGATMASGAGVVTLGLAAWGRDPSPVALRAPTVDACRGCWRRAEADHGDVIEWWEEQPGALHHGFTLVDRPGGDGPIALEVAIDALVAVDPDGRGATLYGDDGATWRYAGLEAWDADGAPVDAWMEALPDGLALIVDDADAVWPIEVDPVLTQGAALIALDAFTQDYFGFPVVDLGDPNGDGFPDVAVAALGNGNGTVYVYYGSASGTDSTYDVVLGPSDPQPSGMYMGTSIAHGDIDGDGIDDVACGAPRFDHAGSTDSGKVYVFKGSLAGLSPTETWSVTPSNQSDQQSGTAVAIGDFDGDGFGDLAQGAPGYDNATSNRGIVRFTWGSAAGVPNQVDWNVSYSQGNALGGSALAAADLDGDGTDELIDGQPGYTGGGRVSVWSEGSNRQISEHRELQHSGGASGDLFGASIAVGDFNGAGNLDVLVGAPGRSGQGAAYVFNNVGLTPGTFSPSGTLANPGAAPAGDSFGYRVAAGDVDGDGYDDALIGSYLDGGGRAWLVRGGTATLSITGAESVAATGIQTDAWFAQDVAIVGDLDGSGTRDALIGAPHDDATYNQQGRAFLFTSACADGDDDGVCAATDCDDGDPGVGGPTVQLPAFDTAFEPPSVWAAEDVLTAATDTDQNDVALRTTARCAWSGAELREQWARATGLSAGASLTNALWWRSPAGTPQSVTLTVGTDPAVTVCSPSTTPCTAEVAIFADFRAAFTSPPPGFVNTDGGAEAVGRTFEVRATWAPGTAHGGTCRVGWQLRNGAATIDATTTLGSGQPLVGTLGDFDAPGAPVALVPFSVPTEHTPIATAYAPGFLTWVGNGACSGCPDASWYQSPVPGLVVDRTATVAATAPLPALPTCSDGASNGDETGVDCGGPHCPSCTPTCP